MRLCATLCLILALCAPAALRAAPAAAPAAATASERLHALFESQWERRLRENPTWASYLGDPRYNDRWPDLRPDAIAASQRADREALQALHAIDRSELADADRLNYDIFALLLERAIAGQRFPTERIPVEHDGGPHSVAERLLQVLRPRTEKDHADWLARLRGYGDYIDQNIALMRAGLASGWVAPRAIMQRLPAQIAVQIVEDPADSRFYAPFAALPESIPQARREALQAQARTAVADTVLPALRRFQAFFNDEYLPRTRASIAAGELPDGKAWYDHLARGYTTTEMDAEAIHALGLSEVARIRIAMEAVRREVGFDGDLAAFFEHLRTDPKFFHADPQALLQHYRAIAKRIDPEVVRIFGRLPRMPYGVVPIPEAVAPDTTTAYYQGPAVDGSRAGYYYVNLYQPETRPIWEMVPLSLHEAVPGHHFQIALAQEMPEQPMFRRVSPFTAYVEGWGLYAEQLGYDMHLYEDPYDRMGQLAYEMWRAVRLVVDTGMHAKGWSRERAIEYFRANAPKTELDIVNEIDRYIATPGQALAYKIGQLKISALRARAEQALGAGFDLRAFHDAVLGAGALPLSVLEVRIDAWIAAQAQMAE
ncbi:MAG TPA: DUF885 domain-containing protein [Xanthomonadaceae bacterium]|nr:DUF885 domain-containing protein [Xanthomonadaceae bacterium]